MAIKITDGLPGGGKTYTVVALEIIPHLAKGGYVVTNVEMIPDGVGKAIAAIHGKKWNPDRLKVLTDEEVPHFFDHVPRGTPDCPVLVVLDELHLWFNSRDWQANHKSAKETFSLATQHRKYHLNIVLITQHLGNIDAQFLKLVAAVTRWVNLHEWKVFGLPLLRFTGFRFLGKQYDRTGKQREGGRIWLRFDSRIGAAYKTHAVHGGGGAMAGAETVEREELPPDPQAAKTAARLRRILAAVLLAAGVGLLGWFLWRRHGPKESPAPPPAAAPAPAPAAAAPAKKTDPPKNAPKPESPLKTPPLVEVLLSSSAGGTEHDPWVIVEIDGARQRLQSGQWFSRGRIATVRRLGNPHPHAVEWWDDEDTRHKFRVIRDTRVIPFGLPTYGTMQGGINGQPSQLQHPAPGGAAVPPGSKEVAPGVMTGPPITIPDNILPWTQ